MKKSVLVICVFMIALAVLAWFSQLTNMTTTAAEFNKSIESAEGYLENGLYQRAIESYEQALALKEKQTVRKSWIDAGKKAFDDGVITDKDFSKMLEKACDTYSNNAEFREMLLAHYLDIGNATNAYDAYKRCKRDGIKSDKITELGIKISYNYSLAGKVYTDYTRATNGYISVESVDEWGVVDPTGERTVDCEFAYVSPFNADVQAVYVAEDARIINKNNVVERVLKETISKAGAYGDGYLPVCDNDGNWKYLNCETGEYEFDTYEAASNFVDGVAAVCKGGKWSLINTKNETVCDTTFDDVKLHSNGDYVYDGIMIASESGKYGMYDEKGKSKGSFTASDMDVYCGGDIAFEGDGGKWGFVSVKGKVSIEGQYENAKSFSNGLAAVSIDGKWGFVNEDNMLAIENQFFEADYFSDKGACMVSSANEQYQVLKLKFF